MSKTDLNTSNIITGGSGNDDPSMVTKVIYSVTACLALIGNILVLVLFFRFPKWLRETHNQCIFSLAVTDILTAVSLLVVSRYVQDSDVYRVPSTYLSREIYCRLVWSHFIPFWLGITSVYTCLALAIERWFAVVRPFLYKRKFGVRTMRVLIALSWVAGFAFQCPVIPLIVGFEGKNGSSPGCKWIVKKNNSKSWALPIVIFIGQTYLPCSLIVFAYLHVISRFRKQTMLELSARASPTSGIGPNHARNVVFKRATIMMAVASMALIASWLPNQVYFFLAQLGYLELKPNIAAGVVGVLAFSNCWMNPIIYGFRNKKFRKEYRRIFDFLIKK